MQRELTRKELDYYDNKLFSFKNINYKIAARKVEIETDKQDSTSVGSSSGYISKIPEQLAIKYDEDTKLKNHYAFKQAVEECRSELNDELIRIFNMRWMEYGNTWEEIADAVNIDRSTVYRRRRKILTIYAECAGELQ